MIPNWLLGKSKSKLQEILGGGGTYTAGEGIDITEGAISVDPLLLSDISDMDDAIPLKVDKTQITNPNILHNPWFTINQRGKNTYTAVGYTVDRWRLDNSAASVSITDDGLSIDNSSDNVNYAAIHEYLTTNISKALLGKNLTLSAKKSDGTILKKSGKAPDTLSGSNIIVLTIDGNTQAALAYNSSKNAFEVLLNAKPGMTSPVIRALKLEIGEISTLAMDPRPDMALERAKCQRYFQRFTFPVLSVIGIAFVQWAGGMRFILPVKQMRTTPTLTVTSQATKIGYTPAGINDATAIESLSIAHVCGDQIVLQALHAGLTAGTVYAMVNMDSDVMYIDFNADL